MHASVVLLFPLVNTAMFQEQKRNEELIKYTVSTLFNQLISTCYPSYTVAKI